jgi:hypothetical protein
MVEKATGGHHMGGNGWPLAKSLTGIPTLYAWSLAYGRNLLRSGLTPEDLLRFIDVAIDDGVPADYALAMGRVWLDQARRYDLGDARTFQPWRIRNVIVWARPNPSVGALGDKFRPATSYITVACRGAKRYFDLDAVRTPHTDPNPDRFIGKQDQRDRARVEVGLSSDNGKSSGGNPAGAPPLDWHSDLEDGDWLWKLSTQPYAGSHYATFPMALPKRLIEAMCPLRVCRECGRPSERIVEVTHDVEEQRRRREVGMVPKKGVTTMRADGGAGTSFLTTQNQTLGWSDCGHDNWRTGVTLDPFAGSGTTLEAAQAVGRHAIGIDLDHRNADLARDRVGMFLDVVA